MSRRHGATRLFTQFIQRLMFQGSVEDVLVANRFNFNAFTRFVLIVSMLLVFASANQAAMPYEPKIADPLLEPWRWQKEEVLDGLGVLCMEEAADGSLWFGNVGSIAHYDGVELSVFPFDDELLGKIRNRRDRPWATALAVLRSGQVVVLIGESLVLYSQGKWEVIVNHVGLSVFSVNLEIAKDGSIWLLVPKALWRVSPDLKNSEKILAASENGFLGSFTIDRLGNIWVAEKDDVDGYQLLSLRAGDDSTTGANWRSYSLPDETNASSLRIIAGFDGRIWYADNHLHPIYSFDPESEEWSRLEGISELRKYTLSLGQDGTIWAGGEQNILRIPSNGEPVEYAENQFDFPDVPLTFFETKSNRLWVIGRIGYVYSIDIENTGWKTYEALHFECEAEDGKQWFRSEEQDTVVVYDPNEDIWTQFDSGDGLIGWVHSVFISSHGLIWASGRHKDRAAIAVFDGTNWTRFLHPEFAAWIEPKAVMESSDGTVWFGAGGEIIPVRGAGGALQYAVNDHGEPHLVAHHRKNGFPYYVTAFAEGDDGAIWIGSTFIYRFDPKTGVIGPRIELGGLNTMDMFFDESQDLWVAKQHAGVYRKQGNGWEFFSMRDGLAGADISSLLELNDGSILAATGSGISRFDGEGWLQHAFPSWLGISRRWSGVKQSRDGSIWFNIDRKEAPVALFTVNETASFRTTRHWPEDQAPQTLVTNYLERVAQPGNTHITWTAHDPWSRTLREGLQFSWRLDGGTWSPFSQASAHTFLDLSSGEHILEVRSRDRAFNIDPTPDKISFTVVAPIWRQVWFIALVAFFSALILALFLVIIRNRERHLLERQADREDHLKELDRIKTGFFTNISHELNTPLTLIVEPLRKVLKTETDPNKRERLSMAVRNANRVVQLVGQILDLQKLEMGGMMIARTEGDLQEALREQVELLQPMAQMHKVSLEFADGEACRGLFDFDKLGKIAQNLIGNAIKYTPAGGAIKVRLDEVKESKEVREVLLTVEDNGFGIAPEHRKYIFERYYRVPETSIVDGSGIGLNLTKEIVELCDGLIEVESPIHLDSKRPGTRFIVRLPIERKQETSKI